MGRSVQEITAPPPSLLLHAEKLLPRPVQPHSVALCPTMDLLAVVTDDQELEVYRLNGQRAFAYNPRIEGGSVDRICWKYSGQLIAIAWDDGRVDMFSAETGKFLQRGTPTATLESNDGARQTPKKTALSWAINFCNTAAVKQYVVNAKSTGNDDSASISGKPLEDWDSKDQGIELDTLLQRQPDLQQLDAVGSLPAQLTLVDVETLLPKLPVLPGLPAGPMGFATETIPDALTSQAAMDSVFHSQHSKDQNAVDVMLHGSDDGAFQARIYNSSLEIGEIKLPLVAHCSEVEPLCTASHPFSSSHAFLAQLKTSAGLSCLTWLPMNLNFINIAGVHLHLMASKASQLQNLLHYVQHTLRCIAAYWKHTQDLPSKFMRNINETLNEKREGSLVDALYHLAATGHCPPTLKEWLIDELAENGHKRWDHVASLGYAKVVDVTHENLLPALDRCDIIVCSLRGLAMYHDSSWMFSAPTKDFTAVLETTRCLRFLGHQILVRASEEKRQFQVFSKWLRYEIDTQATDPSSTSAEEAADRDPMIDYSLLLPYIQNSLSDSTLKPFFEKTENDSLDVLQAYDILQKVSEQPAPLLRSGSPSLSAFAMFQSTRELCDILFTHITAWMSGNTRMAQGLMLEEGVKGSITAMRTIHTNVAAAEMSTFVAVATPNEIEIGGRKASEFNIHEIQHETNIGSVKDSVSCLKSMSVALPKGKVLDMCFIDDLELMILMRIGDTSYLLTFEYKRFTEDGHVISATSALTAMQLPNGAPPEHHQHFDLTTLEKIQPHVKHVFPSTELFMPVKIDVNGRQDRRVVCVMGEDRRHYKVFDLDHSAEEEQASFVTGATEDEVMSG